MPQPFLGEIQLFAFGFSPNDSSSWAFCDGGELNVTQAASLFSLISNKYGGDGVNTFRIPNLVGRAPCAQSDAEDAADVEDRRQVEALRERLRRHHADGRQEAQEAGAERDPRR